MRFPQHPSPSPSNCLLFLCPCIHVLLRPSPSSPRIRLWVCASSAPTPALRRVVFSSSTTPSRSPLCASAHADGDMFVVCACTVLGWWTTTPGLYTTPFYHPANFRHRQRFRISDDTSSARHGGAPPRVVPSPLACLRASFLQALCCRWASAAVPRLSQSARVCCRAACRIESFSRLAGFFLGLTSVV
ncbi:hypothetical protein FB45DRAFT_431393 [Roridomyces roridus]|uniref:Uncharacterized protein n=1 Tax=Roridomyces roridus TaxID=1738132 RepID=A0AAD7AWB9_9AGAR|nr:hypothetical protein FB45DRAFT_431393 [Roridomyces roridus]